MMQAFVVTAPGEGGWQQVDVPVAKADEVLVRVEVVGLCGTDAHIFSGESPNVRLGLTPYPWRPGHEWAGTVVAAGKDVQERELGDRVVGDPFVNCGRCDVCRLNGRSAHCPNRSEIGVRGDRPGALAEFVAVPAANTTLIPDGVTSRDAPFAEPATTALHALQASGLRPGAELAVIGTGTLGLIVAQVAIAGGSQVTAVGVDPVGLELAKSIGARPVRPGEASGGAFRSVIEASGAPSALLEASRLVGVGGRIGLLGYPAAPSVPVDASRLIVQGASIEAVLGGIDRMGDALRLIERGIIRPDVLLEGVHAWDAASELFAGLSRRKPRPKSLIDLTGLPRVGDHSGAEKVQA